MAEIRLREAPKELMNQAEKIQAHFRSNTYSSAFEKLIPQFFHDQETIKRIERENRDLLTLVNSLKERENNFIQMIDVFRGIILKTNRWANELDKDAGTLIKQFGKPGKKRGTKKPAKKTRPTRSARPGKKIVPGKKKKGGKK